ncbi:MAG: oligoendopeptidase [Solirubrobacterales bacterium]|jgi:oligoendopeptidase F|nr:oligoendopeptidase [Solirubrobacterales bacterium]
MSDSATATAADEALARARWNLEPLVDNGGSERALAQLDEAQERAVVFAERYRGALAEIDAGGMAEAMRELEAISDLVGRAGTYASLAFSVDTIAPEVGSLMQRVRERSATLQTTLLFFDLEWNDLDDERAEELLAAPELAFCSHYLRMERRYRPHQLSEPEERILTETSVTGAGAFSRLFTEQTSAITVELSGAGEPLQLMEALSRLLDPDRELRAEAAEAVSGALEPGLRTRAFIYNNLLQDKATRDRLRSFDHWLAARNLDNEASDESVEALIEAVISRYELARRWYRLKARMLGLERLADYDRNAPLRESERYVPYDEAREIVLDCYRDFSPELGATAEEFFTGDHIDAPPARGKRGGAFCSYAVPSAHPYVMLNYTSRPGDVLTMAHELGHGVHASLARPRGVFEFGTPLTVAETASIFGETIVLGRLLEQAPDDAERLSLLGSSLDGAVGAVFRQIAMNRFEDTVHRRRRESGELSVDDFATAWIESQSELLGDTVELSEGYSSWWSYVPHFISTPGYVYAYSYGHLLALSVYSRYEQEGEGFVDSYLELLKAGGSRPPEGLGEIVGVDLTDPGFWNAGLDLIERQLEAAEETAQALT